MMRTALDLLLGIARALVCLAIAILTMAWVASQAGRQDEVHSAAGETLRPVYDLAVRADGKVQYAVIFGAMIAAGEVEGSGSLGTMLENAYFFCRVDCLPGEALLLGCREGAVLAAEQTAGEWQLRELGQLPGLRDVAASSDGRFGAAINNSGDVRVWDLQDHSELAAVQLTADLHALAFASDGSLAIRHGNGSIARLDWRRGEIIGRWPGGPLGPGCIACCPVSTRVASGTVEGRIMIRCFESGRLEHDLSIGPRLVTSLRYCPQGRLLAAGSHDGAITVIDVADGRVVAETIGHKQCVSQLIVLPDGHQLLSSSYDGTIRRWTFPELEELETTEAPPLPASR